MSCFQYRILQVDEMRLSIHNGTLREATSLVGQARPHPAICNSSHPPFPNLTGQPHPTLGLQPEPSPTGDSYHRRPSQSQLTAAQAKLLFMRQENRKTVLGRRSLGPASPTWPLLLRTMVRLCDVCCRVKAGTVHCTRAQQGQLRSAMHLVL